MKTITTTSSLTLAAALAAVTLLNTCNLFAKGTEEKTAPKFPHVIEYELGAFGFTGGDQITITSVRGDRKHIEPGGSYLVEGSYILGSANSADLALYCTTRGPSGPTPIQDGQLIKITKGAGTFHLFETNLADGWLHVSFYPHNSSWHGGVYFGEKGKENTVMREQSWFDKPANESTDKQNYSRSGFDGKANRALLAYLGNPVPPPGDMNPLYNKENLLKAFTAMCGKGDLIITKLAVDDSEFPFLVYGTLDGSHTLPNSIFEGQSGYTYGGCVRGSSGDGATYFAVNIIPSSQFPEDQEKACHRRLMLRLQMLADKAKQSIQN